MYHNGCKHAQTFIDDIDDTCDICVMECALREPPLHDPIEIVTEMDMERRQAVHLCPLCDEDV